MRGSEAHNGNEARSDRLRGGEHADAVADIPAGQGQIIEQHGDRLAVAARRDSERILLAGMATEMCVTQSAIAARELGYKVTVPADACVCIDQRLQQVALE